MSDTLTIHRYHGEHDGDIAACIAKLDVPAPDWSWYEPRPGFALNDNGTVIEDRAADRLHPTLRPGALPDGIPMDEARLFWAWGSLHLLDHAVDHPSGDPTRWALWLRDDAANQPLRSALKADNDSGIPIDVNRDSQHIMLRNGQELKRFGLDWPHAWGSVSAANTRRRLLVDTVSGADGLVGWTITGTEDVPEPEHVK